MAAAWPEFGLCVRWLSPIPQIASSSVHFRRSFAAPPTPSQSCLPGHPLFCLLSPSPGQRPFCTFRRKLGGLCGSPCLLGQSRAGAVCVSQGRLLVPPSSSQPFRWLAGTIAPEEVAPDCL